jgi:hypothetical protein
MKHSFLFSFAILTTLFSGCLTSCQNATASVSYNKAERYSVIVQDGEGFQVVGEKKQKANPGESVSFPIVLETNYLILSVQGGVYDSEKSEIRCADIQENRTVIVSAKSFSSPYSILFDLGQGSLSENPSQHYLFKEYDSTIRTRGNLLTYDQVTVPSGYTLTGWNSESNLSGGRYGLGSRYTLSANGAIHLYANYEKWSDEASFAYTSEGENATITKYSGNEETIVIPNEIGGKLVTRIGAGAFQNVNGAYRLVLNRNLKTLDKGAFVSCSFWECVLFDSLQEVSERSFASCPNFRTLAINVVSGPRYADLWTACWADKFDRVMLRPSDKKQLVFFAGSSLPYGLDSALVEQAFSGAYWVSDLGLSFLIDPGMQFEMLYYLLKKGDIFVHAPEDLSSVKNGNVLNTLSYRVMENNFDMFRLVDIRRHQSVFSSWATFNEERKDLPVLSYDLKSADYNAYGDRIDVRANTDDTDKGYDTVYDANLLDSEMLSVLSSAYEVLTYFGIKVYFSYGPANLNGTAMPSFAKRSAYQTTLESALSYCTSISNLENYLYPGRYFTNTNYHLSNEGAGMRTRQLIKDLQSQMGKDGLL